MKILLSFLLILPLFGQLLRVPLFDRIGIMPTDIMVFVVIGLWIFQAFWKKTVNVFHVLFWPSFFFFTWALFTLLFNIPELGLQFGEAFQAFAYYVRYLAYFLLIFIFLSEIRKKDTQYWQYFLFFSAAALALFGFLQLHFFPSFYDLGMHHLGWDPHIGRLLSTWFDPNFLGGYFAFMLSLLGGFLWSQWKQEKRDWKLYTFGGLFLVLLIALALTYSRSSYLAFLVAGFVFALLAERKLLIVGALAILLLLSFSPRAQERVSDAWMSAQALFTQTEKTLDPTSRLRLQSWQVGWKLFQENPITGVGFNTLKTVQKTEWVFMSKSHAGSGIDSSFLTVLATTGIFGGILFLWIWGIVLWTALQKFLRKQDGFALGFFAGFLGVFVHAIFVNTLFFSLFLPTLFLSAALVLYKKV